MNKQEILINLCTYDILNPDGIINFYDEEDLKEEIKYPNRTECFCDNCFYGRTRLAN